MDATLGILDLPPGLTWTSPALWLSTWFGAGLVSPLRAGLAVATALVVALSLKRRTGLALFFAAVMFLAVVGIVLWEQATGTGDDRRIVIDEVAGFLLMAVILGAVRWQRLLLAAPVYLFIDRWKPWPLEWIEAWHGAVGIIGDDLGAGLMTAVLFLAFDRLMRPASDDRIRP